MRRAGKRGDYSFRPLSRQARTIALRLLRKRTERRHLNARVEGYARKATFPLHVQPEAAIDVEATWFRNQVEMVRWFRSALPADMLLEVREHPASLGKRSLAELRAIKRIPGVRLVGPNTPMKTAIEESDLVLTILGTAAWEAALLGTPTIILVNNYFASLDGIFPCGAPTQLPQTIQQALAWQPNPETNQAHLETMLKRSTVGHWCDVVSKPYVTQADNVNRLADAVQRLVQAPS